jgi:hypothetical protein
MIMAGTIPTFIIERSDPAIVRQATKIADEVCDGPPERCWGWKAKIYDAAFSAAFVALGGASK